MGQVSLIDGHIDDTNRCVCCWEVIPEGVQYCPECGRMLRENGRDIEWELKI